MGKGILVTGTDTGVGKTVVAGGITAVLLDGGVDVGVMKPVESGCCRKMGSLVPEDALFLREMAGCRDELRLVNPYALEHPLAPTLAAEMEGVDVRLEVIREAYDVLASCHDLVVVEGAGGMLSPLTSEHFTADLSRELGCLPLLVVVRGSLGTINHTLLSLHYAQMEGLHVLGVVMSSTNPQEGLVESLNPGAVRRWASVPFLGSIPFLADRGRKSIKDAIIANLDLEPIMQWLKE